MKHISHSTLQGLLGAAVQVSGDLLQPRHLERGGGGGGAQEGGEGPGVQYPGLPGPLRLEQHCDSGARSGARRGGSSGRPDHTRGQSDVRQPDPAHQGLPRPRRSGSQGGPAGARQGRSLQAEEL